MFEVFRAGKKTYRCDGDTMKLWVEERLVEEFKNAN